MPQQRPPLQSESQHRPVEVIPVAGLPEVRPGDDLGALLGEACAQLAAPLTAGDILVVAQKVVSKAEGSRVDLATVTPSSFARRWAEQWQRDPRLVEVVLRESRRIVRMERGMIISETHHGFVCANAGVDLSNSGGEDIAILLPGHPDRSAQQLREALSAMSPGVGPTGRLGVIVADTFGRPWRVGLTQVALGVAGLLPLLDLRDTPDTEGRELHATVIATADQVACAADLVCGKTARVPAAIVRGLASALGEGSGAELLRAPGMDLFR